MCLLDNEKSCCDACGVCIKENTTMSAELVVSTKFFVSKKVLYPYIATIELRPLPWNDFFGDMGAEQSSNLMLNVSKEQADQFEPGQSYTIEIYREAKNVG
jgi:hypothetical protein